MYEKWNAFWARLFGRSYGWISGDKVWNTFYTASAREHACRGSPGGVCAPDDHEA